MADFDFFSGTLLPAQQMSIPSVFDVEKEELYEAAEFFKQPESELILWRRTLEEAITTQKARLICPECKQMVKISGMKTQRGRVCFFTHLKDSDDCQYKTSTNCSKGEIEARKYGLVGESRRHKRLKELIRQALCGAQSREMGVTNVECEKRITSKLPYLNFRRPDVSAEWNGRHLVFELQLSTTFISVVVERDIFYRLNNYDIIWVFNFDENEEYMNLYNLMSKDIYYANKRNVFIFDEQAQQLSLKKGQLVLKCRWLDENNKWTKDKLITLADLQFDEEHHKPFVFDADAAFFSRFPDALARRASIENTRQELMEALLEREEKERMEALKKECYADALRARLKESGESVEPFKEGTKYGFKYNEVVIAQPQYTSVHKLLSGYFMVGFNRKSGLVRKDGEEVVPTEYNLVNVLDGVYDITLARGKCVDLFVRGEKMRLMDEVDRKYHVFGDRTKDNITEYWMRDNRSYWVGEKTLFKLLRYDNCLLVDMGDNDNLLLTMAKTVRTHANKLLPIGMTGLYAATDGSTGMWGIINLEGQDVADFIYKELRKAKGEYVLFSTNGDSWGIMDCIGNQFSRCFAKRLIYLGYGLFAFSNYSTDQTAFWGICDKNGNVLCQETFTYLQAVDENTVRVSDNEYYNNRMAEDPTNSGEWPLCQAHTSGKIIYKEVSQGGCTIRSSGDLHSLLAADNSVLLDFGYTSITYVMDGIFIVVDLNGNYSLYDADRRTQGDKFLRIEHWGDSRFLYVTQSGSALGDHKGPLSNMYSHINMVDDGHFVAYDYNSWGSRTYRMLDGRGQSLSDYVYSNISDFKDGVAEAVYRDRKGLIDINGVPIEMHELNLSGGNALYERMGQHYVKDECGENISPMFDLCVTLTDVLFKVKLEGETRYRVFSSDTNTLSDGLYAEVRVLTGNILLADEGWNVHRVLSGGCLLFQEKFRWAQSINDHFIGLENMGSFPKWAIGTTDGRYVTDFIMDRCPNLVDHRFRTTVGGADGWLDLDGNIIVNTVQENGHYRILEKFGRYALQDAGGNSLVDFDKNVRRMEALSEEFIAVSVDGRRFSLHDCHGEKLSGGDYDSLEFLTHRLFAASKSVNLREKKRSPYGYKYSSVESGSRWGIVDAEGKVIFPFRYEVKPRFVDGNIVIRKDPKGEDTTYTMEQIDKRISGIQLFEKNSKYDATVWGFARGGVVAIINGKKQYIPFKYLKNTTNKLVKGDNLTLLFTGYNDQGLPQWRLSNHS